MLKNTQAVALFSVLLTAATADAASGPNGFIAFSSWDDSGNHDIYRVDPANPSSPPVKLTTDGMYNSNPDWSPDGLRIAYDGWGVSAGPRIRIMDINPATDDSEIVSEPCAPEVGCYGDFQPSWSPNGTRIAFVSSRPNADGTEAWGYQLYVMDALGEVGPLANAVRLTTDVPDDRGKMIENSQVTWSPDGRRIAFLSRGRGAGPDTCDLWVMEPWDKDGDGFGDNLKRLTSDESSNCDPIEDMTPQWSPNSSLIAFTSVRSGYYDIWVVNADDPADLRNVTRTPDGYEDQPGWSPDGAQIIFRSDLSGAYQLYSLPVPPPSSVGIASSRAVATRAPTRQQLTFDRRTKQQSDWGKPRGTTRGTRTLAVTTTGNGRINSAPAGIACGADCAGTFVAGRKVQLTATPRPGYAFKGWGGACLGTTGKTCVLTMDKWKTARAVFGS